MSNENREQRDRKWLASVDELMREDSKSSMHDRRRGDGMWSGVRKDSPYVVNPRRRIPVPAVVGAVLSILVVASIFFVLRTTLFSTVPESFEPNSNDEIESDAAELDEKSAEIESSSPMAVELRLAMIGDILQHHYVFESGHRSDGSYNFDHIFAHIASELATADIKVVNQETPLGGADLGYSGYPRFNGPQEMGDAEAAVGFNVVLRASNHAMDMGYMGLHNELAFWASAHPEIDVIGAVDPDAAASGTSPYTGSVWEGKGMRVALLNFTYDLNGFEDPNAAVALLDDWHREQVLDAVAAADATADAVVVFPHWGTEYQLTADDNQRAWAQALIEAGADVIIGGHPHVIEPFEVLSASDGRQVPCFWSVGNFVSTQTDNENLVGCMAEIVLRKESDGVTHAVHSEFLPLVTHKGVGEQMTSYLLRDYTDDLAASNGIAGHSYNTDLTQTWADDFCGRVLGDTYDATTHSLIWDMSS